MADRSRSGPRPRVWFTFVELDPFTSAWKRLGLQDADLRDLQIELCAQPDKPPVMSGTGGLRKMRFAPYAWKTGLSGAIRIYYAYFPDFGLVALVYAHSKNDMSEISDAQKKAIKSLIQDIQRYLEAKRDRRRNSGGKHT